MNLPTEPWESKGDYPRAVQSGSEREGSCSEFITPTIFDAACFIGIVRDSKTVTFLL